jgi:teichuronic acid biosynthesis glycosyltransferase TuaH
MGASLITTTRELGRRKGLPALGGNWDGLVTICAANGWDTVKVADQHLAEHLARHVPVLYVDPPVSPLSPQQ